MLFAFIDKITLTCYLIKSTVCIKTPVDENKSQTKIAHSHFDRVDIRGVSAAPNMSMTSRCHGYFRGLIIIIESGIYSDCSPVGEYIGI